MEYIGAGDPLISASLPAPRRCTGRQEPELPQTGSEMATGLVHVTTRRTCPNARAPPPPPPPSPPSCCCSRVSCCKNISTGMFMGIAPCGVSQRVSSVGETRRAPPPAQRGIEIKWHRRPLPLSRERAFVPLSPHPRALRSSSTQRMTYEPLWLAAVTTVVVEGVVGVEGEGGRLERVWLVWAHAPRVQACTRGLRGEGSAPGRSHCIESTQAH